jgi:hypothetical protein
MYSWFAEHLELEVGQPIVEDELVPIPPAELSVFDAEHPVPERGFDLARIRAHLLAREVPAEAAGPALRALVHPRRLNTSVPPRASAANETVILVVSSAGLELDIESLRGERTIAVEVFGVGDSRDRLQVDGRHGQFVGYTWGYNRTLIAERVDDILAAVTAAWNSTDVVRVRLLGVGDAGPWVILAAALAGDAVDRTLVEGGWTFADIDSLDDPNLLPGALRYGGLRAFAALIPADRLRIDGPLEWLSE